MNLNEIVTEKKLREFLPHGKNDIQSKKEKSKSLRGNSIEE